MTALLPFLVLSALSDLAICLSLDCGVLLMVAAAIGFYIVSFLGWLLVYVLFLSFCSLFINTKKQAEHTSGFWCFAIKSIMGIVCALAGARIRLEGAEKIPQGKWLFVCNHLSGYDPFIAGWALRRYDIAFITKPSIMRIPVARRILPRACFMDIDRENDRQALKTILRAAAYLKNDVTNIGIYPEGTRSKTGQLQEFRNGSFKIAQKAQKPVVVAYIRYSRRMRINPFGRNEVYLKICKVISADELAEMKTNEIGEEVRRCIMLENA